VYRGILCHFVAMPYVDVTFWAFYYCATRTLCVQTMSGHHGAFLVDRKHIHNLNFMRVPANNSTTMVFPSAISPWYQNRPEIPPHVHFATTISDVKQPHCLTQRRETWNLSQNTTCHDTPIRVVDPHRYAMRHILSFRIFYSITGKVNIAIRKPHTSP